MQSEFQLLSPESRVHAPSQKKLDVLLNGTKPPVGQQSFSKWQMMPLIYLYLGVANMRNEYDAWVSNVKGTR